MRRTIASLAAALALVMTASASAREKKKIKVHSAKDALWHFKQGCALFEDGKLDDAIPELRAALEHDQDEAYWHMMLGEALEKKGDRQSAAEELRLAVQLSPDDCGLRENYRKLVTELGATPPTETDTSCDEKGAVEKAGGSVTHPQIISAPEPPYSEKARAIGYEGALLMLIVVDKQGNVSNIRVVKPLGFGLDQEAIRTVKTWKFQPARTRDGVPVPARMTVEVTFRLFNKIWSRPR